MLYKKEKQTVLHWREDIITASVILICLALFYFFPAKDTMQNITRSIFFLVIIPVLYIKIILKKDLKEFGLSLSEPKQGFFWSGIMLAVSIAIGLILIFSFNLKKNYILPAYLLNSFWLFLLYEFVLVNFFFFIQEFFFKGFVLFSFLRKLGWVSVLISFAIYFLLILFTGNLNWQIAPMLILAATGGIVSYKSRSFVYAYMMGLVFLVFFDTFLIHILNK
jgi:membrane protease YdiL (CAAX protease family)